MKSSKLTKEEVLHLAKLVNLQLSEDEVDLFRAQLGETIDYIKNLEELDTKNVIETSHTTDSHNISFKDGESSTRTFSQDQATKNAKGKKDGYFVVSKILDK